MSLDELGSLEWSEWVASQSEQPSEQQREKTAQALAGIKRTRKDESKAQRDNDFLYKILYAIITSGKYDEILPTIFPLFDDGIPSNILVGGFSLIYSPASEIIRRHYTAEKNGVAEPIDFHYELRHETVAFDEETLDPAIRKRINQWIDDIFSVISHDPSTIMTHRSIHILSGKLRKPVVVFFAAILIFFLAKINIDIPKEKATVYADYIVSELKRKLESLSLEKI